MKRVGLWAAIGIGICITVGLITVEQGYAKQATQGIEGVWDVSVTIRQCDTSEPIATVRAMHMYIHGGTITEVGNDFLRGSGLGTWRHLHGHSYTAVFRFFTFNADGSFAGRNQVSRTIELSKDADAFTATASIDIFDTDDNLILTVCATDTATRLE